MRGFYKYVEFYVCPDETAKKREKDTPDTSARFKEIKAVLKKYNYDDGIIAMEGTVKTLSPNVNILNFFTNKVDIGLNFNLNLENPGEMNPEIAVKLLQLANGITESSTKTAEVLDMLEKGQVKVRTDFSFEEKALGTVNHLTAYVVRALMVIALFIGSCMLCIASAIAGRSAFTTVFLVIGLIGYALSVFFAWRVYRNIKKSK